MRDKNFIKNFSHCGTFLIYSILSIVVYMHPQYKNMFAMSLTFSILAIIFIFFNIFTYDNHSHTICIIKNIFFAISIIAISIFLELIREFFKGDIYDTKKRVFILVVYFVISFFITLIIKKHPLFVVPFLVLFAILRLFRGLSGYYAFRSISKELPEWFLIYLESFLFGLIIVLMQVYAISVIIKDVIEWFTVYMEQPKCFMEKLLVRRHELFVLCRNGGKIILGIWRKLNMRNW